MEKNTERTRYKCTSCKYEFTRTTKANVDHCPYCSKKGSVAILKGDFASKILDEVSKYDRMSED